jgi:hypothetical protein
MYITLNHSRAYISSSDLKIQLFSIFRFYINKIIILKKSTEKYYNTPWPATVMMKQQLGTDTVAHIIGPRPPPPPPLENRCATCNYKRNCSPVLKTDIRQHCLPLHARNSALQNPQQLLYHYTLQWSTTQHQRHKKKKINWKPYYCTQKYKVFQIWPGQTVTCSHTNRPGHIWTTLYLCCDVIKWRFVYRIYVENILSEIYFKIYA